MATAALVLTLPVSVDIVAYEMFIHRVKMRFQIIGHGFGNQFNRIGDPALLHQVLCLLQELIGGFGFEQWSWVSPLKSWIGKYAVLMSAKNHQNMPLNFLNYPFVSG